MYYW
jgi:hypothetical protein